MDFKFYVDAKYLLLKMISNRGNLLELEQWKKSVVSNLLDKTTIEEIEKNKETIEEFFMNPFFKEFVKQNDLDSKMNLFLQNTLFCKYYNETLNYKNLMEESWQKEKEKIKRWLREKIKLNTFKDTTNVFVTHPYLNMGKCVNQETIFFGHWKGLKDINYNLTYLCHEELHRLLPNENYMPPAMKLYYTNDKKISNQTLWKMLNKTIEDYSKIYDFEFDIIHAVIELITDNELYTLLNNTSKYEEGHKHLVQYKKWILPYWFYYLGLSSMEIQKRTFNSNVKECIELEKNDTETIENFIQFLIEKSDIREKVGIPNLADANLKR